MHLVVHVLVVLLLRASQALPLPPAPTPRSSSISPQDLLRNQLRQKLSLVVAVIAPLATSVFPARSVESLLQDTLNRFNVLIPDGFTIVKRNVPPVTMSQFLSEEILLSASSFSDVPGSYLKGASVSVTRTQARRLLKDFEVEWWFAPIEKIEDLGSPQLIAQLLILQRQGTVDVIVGFLLTPI